MKKSKRSRTPKLDKRSAAFKLFSQAGKKGRKAKMEKTTPEERSEWARKAALASAEVRRRKPKKTGEKT